MPSARATTSFSVSNWPVPGDGGAGSYGFVSFGAELTS